MVLYVTEKKTQKVTTKRTSKRNETMSSTIDTKPAIAYTRRLQYYVDT